ncbi:ABC transporter substrate-binding protein [Roseomonas sp. OT10]|uniref:ABC transporter substrate-binding protein n=1 Tax=Roseomonas cutis TaxID=2897332 RepID=UPI001E4D517E|nr:ABC transporter substrate-binding protein [Roseomonas sp. OT10]UFN48917.1 ABC transporter substrate-binding protein [Roseomonas sp. OT10]
MRRRALLLSTATIGSAGLGIAGLDMTGLGMAAPALAQGAAGDPIRPIILLTRPQAAAPAAWQAAELLAQEWRKLGLTIELRPMPIQQLTQTVWYERQRWDATMWAMTGRPERSDPDELVYNLFHSANIASGYNFVGYSSPDYDRLAEAQRTELDLPKRQALMRELQERINQDQPYAFLVHPVNLQAFNKRIFAEGSVVMQAGLGLRNFWNWIGLAPSGNLRDIVLNSTEPVRVIHPFNIGGIPDSWANELVWDRVMRVGPDGLPKPWAAETVTLVDPTTIDCVIREGMTFHDGSPVTVEDIVFSFRLPGTGDEAPMYKPFVANIASVEATGPRTVRFTLRKPDAAFQIATLSKLNIVPKALWEPVLRDYMGRPENLESYLDEKAVGSGPYRFVRHRTNEEVVLEANPNHWSRPKADRLIIRIITNIESTLGALRRGEVNVLADYPGDPEPLRDLVASQSATLALREGVDIGFQYAAFNLRRPPFSDPAFRRALSTVANREMMAGAAWGGQAVPSNSLVSPALEFWHDPGIEARAPGGGLEAARRLLQEAGYRVVGGRLCYPAGTRETARPFQ